MGQAFDRDGNILGELEANSFREVLDKLQLAHPKAEEFRIKSMEKRLEDERRAGRAAETVAPEPMLQFFQYAHLPAHLQDISRPYCEQAEKIAAGYPRNPERTVTLRKLLEAKDAAVRTFLYK